MDRLTVFYFLGGVIAIPIIIKIIIFLEYFLRKRIITRREYKNCRGTIHKKLLKYHIKKLRNIIQDEKDLLKKTRKTKAKIEKEKKAELEKAASRYIFQEEFTDIPGIGKKLKERVERTVFDGTLDSLHQAHRVYGIGDTKYSEIYFWVEHKKRDLPNIQSSDFTGKTGIINRYDKQLAGIIDEIAEIQGRLSPLKDLLVRSEGELKSLDKVSAKTFLRSYDGDKGASELVMEYYHGVFPEWGRMPSWFSELMEVAS